MVDLTIDLGFTPFTAYRMASRQYGFAGTSGYCALPAHSPMYRTQSSVAREIYAMSEFEINAFLGRTSLRQIEIVAALYKYGSITKTAQALEMSVANVSRSSKRFEANLDIRLFEGNGRRFVLRKDASNILECLSGLTEQIALLRSELSSNRALPLPSRT
jgi:hypothetical protein